MGTFDTFDKDKEMEKKRFSDLKKKKKIYHKNTLN